MIHAELSLVGSSAYSPGDDELGGARPAGRWLGNDSHQRRRRLGAAKPASAYIVPAVRFCRRWWPLSLVTMHVYCAVYLYVILQQGPVRMTRVGPELIVDEGSAAAGEDALPPVVAAVHVFASLCFTPLNFMCYMSNCLADSLLRDTGPPGWNFDTAWQFCKADKTLYACGTFGIFYSAFTNLNPWYHWHSVEEQIMWVFLYVNTVFMFVAVCPTVACFMRILQFIDEMSDELDASLEHDTSDSVRLVIQCRATVLSRTRALTERCATLINIILLTTLWAWLTGAAAIFQDKSMIPVFLWFTLILALMLWELSRVNNRYMRFTRRFHGLSQPTVRELEAAYTYLKQQELQVIVLGLPITRTVFARFLGSACIPLLVSIGKDSINGFATAGYF